MSEEDYIELRKRVLYEQIKDCEIKLKQLKTNGRLPSEFFVQNLNWLYKNLNYLVLFRNESDLQENYDESIFS